MGGLFRRLCDNVQQYELLLDLPHAGRLVPRRVRQDVGPGVRLSILHELFGPESGFGKDSRTWR